MTRAQPRRSALLAAALLLGLPAAAGAGTSDHERARRALDAAECLRHRVVWSGGIARRGPDRVRPRPVRTRWQTPAATRLRCEESPTGRFLRWPAGERPWLR